MLDDYTPLRHVTVEMLDQDAAIFPIKDALLYVERSRLGGGPGGKAFSGASLFTAPNPEYGATITFNLKETLKTRKAKRKEAEKRADWDYPTVDEFRAEDDEVPPKVFLEISDESGDVIRRVDAPSREGVHRVRAKSRRFACP